MKSFYLIINPKAGKTDKGIKDAIEDLEKWAIKSNASLFYNDKLLKEDAREDWNCVDSQYQESKGYDGIIVIGGDGTKTHIINQMINNNDDRIFIGVSSGTMDVGVCTNRASSLKPLNELEKVDVNAIEARVDGKHYYSFIDSIICNTFIGNKDGEVSQFSAKEILLNRTKILEEPKVISSNKGIIEIYEDNKLAKRVPLSNSTKIIGCSCLDKGLFAKVLAGGADTCICLGAEAGLIYSDFPLILTRKNLDELLDLSPISSSFIPLKVNNTMTITGLNDDAYLINDGNVISKINQVEFSLKKKVFSIWR